MILKLAMLLLPSALLIVWLFSRGEKNRRRRAYIDVAIIAMLTVAIAGMLYLATPSV